MRVAIVAECFLPAVNGVTNSVLRVVEQLERADHQALVIAPGRGPTTYSNTPVVRVPSVACPFYRSMPVGVPTGQVRAALSKFRPDVVHLAAPVMLGTAGVRAARSLSVPAVAVYQTDLAGFARRYGGAALAPAVWRWLRCVHQQADLTLAPSSHAVWELRRHGIGRVEHWARGVDHDRFNARHRSELLRRRWAPDGEVVVGYVGRLAKEKQVHLLRHLTDLPGTRLVVVGDGPARPGLQRNLPNAIFAGFKAGVALSQMVASLDVFVHTGTDETFCQSMQEALASGVPVVAAATGGPVDLIRQGDNGWLYPVAKPALLRGAVESLVADPGLRRAMAMRARESVEHRTWEALGTELVDHYRRLTGRRDEIRRVA